MKTPIHLFLFLLLTICGHAQITTPVIKAGFGVDGDLRANYFNGFVQAGNDDWFSDGTPGSGSFVIDTNGSYSMTQRYLVDPAFRKQPFFRTMRVPQLSIVNNRLWIDAVYIRDYNGQSGGDETAFVNSNKNGDNPGVWNGGVTSVLNKNDIAEMMVHVRRAGPNKGDNLWFFGGLSLQGTTGNRFFDFELYQTDIFYTRSTGKFSNYGPDAGHTSWQFDAAGNITKPGDVIFTAEYSSSSLSYIEARVWVDKAMLSKPVSAFTWTGSFDGASTGSQFGYAGIVPKTAGDYYMGLQSGNGTWAGPYGFIDGSNAYQTTYPKSQYMEFSVDLTKLGLDPITLLGGSACGLPFRRILVKTRSSTSFSSELKDFIGPFDFFNTAPVQAVADVPFYCGPISVSTIMVQNPLPASVYTWSTTNGHIVYDSVGTSITVDKPGTYIVSQQLLDGCSTSSKDTVVITHDSTCIPMSSYLLSFSGSMVQKQAQLKWKASSGGDVQEFMVQRSTNGKTFENVGVVSGEDFQTAFGFTDPLEGINVPVVYYRLLIKGKEGKASYSPMVKLRTAGSSQVVDVFPNPATNFFQLSIPSDKNKTAVVNVFDAGGRNMLSKPLQLVKGENAFTINNVKDWQAGIYMLSVQVDGQTSWQKLVVKGHTAIKD